MIVVAAAAAIIGDNVGYWLGRKGGRGLLARTPIVRTYFERALPPAERFFDRHGPKTVFIARWVALPAGHVGMARRHQPHAWWRFLLWNAAGGILWATVVGLVAYEFGMAAADAISKYGLYGGIAVVILIVLAFIGYKVFGKRFRDARAMTQLLGPSTATAGALTLAAVFSAAIYPGRSHRLFKYARDHP